MTRKITLVPGDGIGPELTLAAKRVVGASGADIEWEEVKAGLASLEEGGELVPAALLDSIERNKVCLKAPITTPIGRGFRSVNVQLRTHFDLFQNIRPVRSVPGLEGPFKDINLVIFRENTEDLYAGLEEDVSPDEKRSIKVISRKGSERIARAAFDYAQGQAQALKGEPALGEVPRGWQRPKVTVVSKANIMKLTDGLFLEVCRQVAGDYPQIDYEEVLVDAMAMKLVLQPQQYDIILTENLYGDILSDLCAGLVGGLGLLPGANIGRQHAIFEAVHGTGPDIAGQDKANPTAFLLAACMMLEYIGEGEAAARIRRAVQQALAEPESRTADLGGPLGTQAFADGLIRRMEDEGK